MLPTNKIGSKKKEVSPTKLRIVKPIRQMYLHKKLTDINMDAAIKLAVKIITYVFILTSFLSIYTLHLVL